MSFELFPEPQVKSPGNAQSRRGRGFSVEETNRAGLTITEARQMGLIVDPRRKTVHDENVEVLKQYLKELDRIIAEVEKVKPETAKKPAKKEPVKEEPAKKKTPEKEPAKKAPTKKKAPKKEPAKKPTKAEPAKEEPVKKKPTKKEEKAIAELSSLRAVKKEEAEKLVAAGIVTLSDLAFCEIDKVAKKTGIDVDRISAMMTAALKRI